MTPAPLVTVVGGGLGGARLALGLQAVGLESECCFVTNVGDDVEVGGLPVCPDTDAVLYALAGVFDDERGWGVRGDRFDRPLAGAPPWFNVGRRDATHQRRRLVLLDGGLSLSAATAALAQELGVAARVVPATDDRVRTRVRVGGTWLSFQEWLVRDRAEPAPDEVSYERASDARPAPGVVEALAGAALVVFASSSPIASLAPTLAVPGVAEAVRSREAPTVAVSPVAARRELVSDRDERRAKARAALLASRGVDHSPVAIAAWFRGFGDGDLVDGFVLDRSDAEDLPSLQALGFDVMVAPVVGETPEERASLVDVLVQLARKARA